MSVPSVSLAHVASADARPGGESSSSSSSSSSSAPSGAALRVQAVFHDVDARHADQIAAEMVSRAHELANLPEHACDVDVNVELTPPPIHPGDGDDDAR